MAKTKKKYTAGSEEEAQSIIDQKRKATNEAHKKVQENGKRINPVGGKQQGSMSSDDFLKLVNERNRAAREHENAYQQLHQQYPGVHRIDANGNQQGVPPFATGAEGLGVIPTYTLPKGYMGQPVYDLQDSSNLFKIPPMMQDYQGNPIIQSKANASGYQLSDGKDKYLTYNNPKPTGYGQQGYGLSDGSQGYINYGQPKQQGYGQQSYPLNDGSNNYLADLETDFIGTSKDGHDVPSLGLMNAFRNMQTVNPATTVGSALLGTFLPVITNKYLY